jgi:hypothetical protein
MPILTTQQSTIKSSLPAANTLYRGGQFPAYGAVNGSDITPGVTEVLLSKTVLASTSTGAVNITNIPQSYSTLCLYVHTLSSYNVGTGAIIVLYLGNTSNVLDTGSNYNNYGMVLLGSTASFFEHLANNWIYAGEVSSVFTTGSTNQRCGCVKFTLPHYTNTSWKKGVLVDSYFSLAGSTGNLRRIGAASEWASTAAIGSLSLQMSGNLQAGTIVTLTGIP